MTKRILQSEDPILRGTAKEVPVEDITSPKIQKVLDDMKKALASQDDGVAIAAPQVGVPLRIFVVSGKSFYLATNESDDEDELKKGASGKRDLVFINPVITKLSREKKFVEEGCLSVRWWYGKVQRSVKASILAYDERGKKVERGGSGLLAQIFQHEVDHLNGILFTDKARDLQEIPPEEISRLSSLRQ